MDLMIRPYKKCFAVTPNDGADLAYRARALIINGPGVVVYVDWEDLTWTTNVLPAGVHPIMAKKVFATGTTATGISAGAD